MTFLWQAETEGKQNYLKLTLQKNSRKAKELYGHFPFSQNRPPHFSHQILYQFPVFPFFVFAQKIGYLKWWVYSLWGSHFLQINQHTKFCKMYLHRLMTSVCNEPFKLWVVYMEGGRFYSRRRIILVPHIFCIQFTRKNVVLGPSPRIFLALWCS